VVAQHAADGWRVGRGDHETDRPIRARRERLSLQLRSAYLCLQIGEATFQLKGQALDRQLHDEVVGAAIAGDPDRDLHPASVVGVGRLHDRGRHSELAAVAQRYAVCWKEAQPDLKAASRGKTVCDFHARCAAATFDHADESLAYSRSAGESLLADTAAHAGGPNFQSKPRQLLPRELAGDVDRARSKALHEPIFHKRAYRMVIARTGRSITPGRTFGGIRARRVESAPNDHRG
jgi:hypothetical protein